MIKKLATATAMAALLAGPAAVQAGVDEAKTWVESEFQPSTLSQEDQMKEMEWFIKAAEPFKGMDIKVVSETITTHEYESKTLAKAFTEITGINVTHDLIGEGDVIEKLQTQMQSNKNIYDAYINDSDLIGTHFRYKQAVNLTDWMSGEGKAVTNPGLDIDDFTETFISFLISSLQTSTGSVMTGSNVQRSKPNSKKHTDTSLVYL